MNPLTDVLNPLWRRRVYSFYALAVVVAGGIQVGYGTAEAAQPQWLKISLSVLAYLGGLLGATAASNVTIPKTRKKKPKPEQ